MSSEPICSICKSKAAVDARTGDSLTWHCPRCGDFSLTSSAESMLLAEPFKSPPAISGWVRQLNAQGMVPTIDSDSLSRLRTYSKPPLRERVERYLLAAATDSPNLAAYIEPVSEKLIGISFSDDAKEVAIILNYLESKRFIFRKPGGSTRITAEGYIEADDLRNRRSLSSQAFVAMWFDPQMNTVRDKGLIAAIEGAGYDAMVISNKEHANKIDDEIIAEIRRSAFLVADFTGHRGGVYFEAGFAMGLGLQVIWTCRHDEIKNLHFDIRQYNCIAWKDENDLAKQLKNRIEAIMGRGPKD